MDYRLMVNREEGEVRRWEIDGVKMVGYEKRNRKLGTR